MQKLVRDEKDNHLCKLCIRQNFSFISVFHKFLGCSNSGNIFAIQSNGILDLARALNLTTVSIGSYHEVPLEPVSNVDVDSAFMSAVFQSPAKKKEWAANKNINPRKFLLSTLSSHICS